MEKELNDEELCNWLKACIALKYFKEGIMPFIHQQCENIFIQNVSKVQARCNLSQYICKVCVIDTLKPSHAKNNPCSKRKCNCKIANTILCKDNGSCSELYDLLRDNHRHNEPNFSNKNCSLWSDPTRGPWEQMKCFIFTPGYKYTAHESDADVTSLIQIFENNKELQNVLGICFADFDQVRKDRNAIYHSGNMTMSKADLRCYIYHVKTVLELPMFQNYVSTLYLIAKLTELETNTTRITTQNEIDIREEVMKALKESKKELEMHAEQGRNVADELRRLMDAENANTVKLEKIFGEHIKTLFDQIKETRETIQLERNEFRRDLSATINNIDELRREHGVHYRGIQEILQILQQNDRLPRGIKRKRAEPERHDVVRAVIKVLCSTNKDLVSEKIVKIAKGCTQDDDPQLLSEVASVLEQLQKDGNIIVDIKNECVALYISVPSLQNWIHLCRDFFNGALMQLLQPLQNYLRTLPKCGALELRMNISEHDLIKSFASLLDRISPVLASKTFSDRHDVNVTIELLQELQFKLCVYNRKAKALAESLDEVAKLIEERERSPARVMVRGSIWVAGVAAMAAVRLGLVGLGVSLISGAVVVAIGGHSEHTLNKDIVSRSEAYKKAKRILQTILQTHKDIVVGSNHIIDILGQEKLEERFPPLANILKRYIGGNAEISILNALKLIRNTAFEIRRGGMTFSIVERKSKMTWEDEFVIWKINKLMKSKPTEPNLQLFEVVWKISGMTKMLLETCRSDEEIEHLINDTIRRIEQ